MDTEARVEGGKGAEICVQSEADRMRFCSLTYEIIEELKMRRKLAAENERKLERLLHDRFSHGWKLEEERKRLSAVTEKQDAAARDSARHVQDALRDSKVEMAQHEMYRKLAEQEKETLKEEFKKLQLCNYTLEKRLRESEHRETLQVTEREQYIQKVSGLHAQSKLLHDSAATLQNKQAHLDQQFEQVKEIVHRLEYRCQHQTCILAERDQEISHLRDQILQHNIAEHSRHEDGSEDRQAEIGRLQAELQLQTDRNSDLTTQLEDWKHKYWESLKQVKESHRQVSVHLHTAASYRDQCLSTERERNEVIDKLEVTTADKDRLTGQVEDLKQQLDKQVDLQTAKERELEEKTAQLMDTETRLQEAQETMDSLHTQLKHLQAVVGVEKHGQANQTELCLLNYTDTSQQCVEDTIDRGVQVSVDGCHAGVQVSVDSCQAGVQVTPDVYKKHMALQVMPNTLHQEQQVHICCQSYLQPYIQAAPSGKKYKGNESKDLSCVSDKRVDFNVYDDLDFCKDMTNLAWNTVSDAIRKPHRTDDNMTQSNESNIQNKQSIQENPIAVTEKMCSHHLIGQSSEHKAQSTIDFSGDIPEPCKKRVKLCEESISAKDTPACTHSYEEKDNSCNFREKSCPVEGNAVGYLEEELVDRQQFRNERNGQNMLIECCVSNELNVCTVSRKNCPDKGNISVCNDTDTSNKPCLDNDIEVNQSRLELEHQVNYTLTEDQRNETIETNQRVNDQLPESSPHEPDVVLNADKIEDSDTLGYQSSIDTYDENDMEQNCDGKTSDGAVVQEPCNDLHGPLDTDDRHNMMENCSGRMSVSTKPETREHSIPSVKRGPMAYPETSNDSEDMRRQRVKDEIESSARDAAEALTKKPLSKGNFLQSALAQTHRSDGNVDNKSERLVKTKVTKSSPASRSLLLKTFAKSYAKGRDDLESTVGCKGDGLNGDGQVASTSRIIPVKHTVHGYTGNLGALTGTEHQSPIGGEVLQKYRDMIAKIKPATSKHKPTGEVASIQQQEKSKGSLKAHRSNRRVTWDENSINTNMK